MMDNTPQPTTIYDDIFEVCWQAIQAGESTLDACLRQYPAHADDLKRDLTLAMAIEKLPQPVMSQSSEDALEARLRQQFRTQFPNATAQTTQQTTQQERVLRPRPSFWLGKSAAAVVLAFLMFLGGTGTAVAASATSMPDQPLYQVKRLWESVVVIIAQVVGNLDDVWLQLAQTRLEEVLYLIGQGDTDGASDLLADLSIALNEAHENADDDTETRVITFALSAQTIMEQSPLVDDASYGALDALVRTVAPSSPTPMPALLVTPTLIPAQVLPSATPTLIPSATATLLVATETPVNPPATSTPRFAATATATSSPTATLTFTPSPIAPSDTPTATWTALPPLPSITPNVASTLRPSATPREVMPTSTPASVNGTQYFIRQTDQAVQMTQTAIAEDPVETREP
jgi:hypothetical protein